jgi:hypothetical protein
MCFTGRSLVSLEVTCPVCACRACRQTSPAVPWQARPRISVRDGEGAWLVRPLREREIANASLDGIFVIVAVYI